MKPKVILWVALMSVLSICTTASAQGEEITLSTYYPAPFGEYDELCAEKLLVDTPSATELQDMARGDCHITRSLIVGQGGAPGGFSYDEIGGTLTDGTVLIKGDIGIGMTNPQRQLDVAGDMRVTDWLELPRTGYDTGELRLTAPGSGTIWNLHNRGPDAIAGGDANKLYLTYYNGTTWFGPYLTVANNGNVGIGTATPANRLDIEGSLAVGANYAGTTTAPANGMIIEGNVGIGTTNPGVRLWVSRDIVGAITKTGVGLFEVIRPGFGASRLSIHGDSESNNWIGTEANENLNLGSGIVPEAIFIQGNSGNVGIGTTAPLTKVHIHGDNGAGLLFTTAGTEYSAICMTTNADSPGYNPADWGTYKQWKVSALDDDNPGNWGPYFPNNFLVQFIDLNKDVRNHFYITPTGVIKGTYVSHGPSDIRLKKDIVTIPNALEKVLALRGVNFNWKKPELDDGRLHMGMIGQEVEKVVPEVVRTADDKMKTKSIDFKLLVALLVEAVKQQQKEIVNLEGEITQLKVQLSIDQ